MNRIFSHIGCGRLLVWLVIALLFAGGCGRLMDNEIGNLLYEDSEKIGAAPEAETPSEYYSRFFEQVIRMQHKGPAGEHPLAALDALPKDAYGNVNWTASVVSGLINPRGSLDPNVEDEKPLDLNVFIEAKVPLMANVLFPHSIHTYWLSCNNCHPGIFIPEAGANPISMDEIFKGKWCGRCHGKVAFNFWPMSNCRRCHIVLKYRSLEKERFK